MSQSSQRPVTNSSKPPASSIQTAKLHWQLDDNGVTAPSLANLAMFISPKQMAWQNLAMFLLMATT